MEQEEAPAPDGLVAEHVAEPTHVPTFEKLDVWNEACDLATEVYGLFHECRDFDFRQQIQRAAVSISTNIAEGYERDSNQEFIRFLVIAKGSCGEVRSLTHLARRVRLLGEVDADRLIASSARLREESPHSFMSGGPISPSSDPAPCSLLPAPCRMHA